VANLSRLLDKATDMVIHERAEMLLSAYLISINIQLRCYESLEPYSVSLAHYCVIKVASRRCKHWLTILLLLACRLLGRIIILEDWCPID